MDVYKPAFRVITDQIMQRVKVALQDMAHAYSMHLCDLGSIDRPQLSLKQRARLADPLEAFYGEISNGITIMPTRLRFDIVLHPQNNVEAYDAEFRKGLEDAIRLRHPDHNTIVFAWVHKPLFQHILNSKAQVTGRANVDSAFILGTVPPGFFREKSGQLEVPAQPALPAQPTDEDYAAIADYNTKAPKAVRLKHFLTDESVWFINANGEPAEITKTLPAPSGVITQEALDEVATCAFQEMKRRRREERARENEKTNTAVDRNVFWRRPILREDCLDFRGDDLSNAMSAPAEHMTIHTMMRSPPRVMQATTTPRLFRRIK